MISHFQEEDQEHCIQNKLHDLAEQDHRFIYQSQDLLQTFKKTKFLPVASPSFGQLSDWNSDRYNHANNSSMLLKQRPKIKNIENEYQKFSLSLSKTKNSNMGLTLPSKTKIQIAPINMKFKVINSNHHHRANQKNKSRDTRSSSFYDSHYQPLNILYKIKTKHKESKQKSFEQLPLIIPKNHHDQSLPKTERVSSIMRSMKKNQQIKEIRKRHIDVAEPYKLPI